MFLLRIRAIRRVLYQISSRSRTRFLGILVACTTTRSTSNKREKDHVADAFFSGQDHDDPIDAESGTSVRRHPMTNGLKEVLVQVVGFFSRNLLRDQPVELLGRDRDRDVVQPTEHLAVLPEVEAGEVEIGEIVIVTDIEEEVGGTPVVPVLEELGQRELQQVLLERDRPLDVTAQQGEMVQAPGR